VKFGRVVFDICERTDRQTDRQTDTKFAILRNRPENEVISSIFFSLKKWLKYC